jgi:probable rRNA maturation factor
MSTAVGVSTEGVRIALSRERVGEIVRAVLRSEGVRDAMLSVSFVPNTAIRALNRKHLRRDRITDVIAFSFRPAGKRSPIVGDVYIAPAVARASARANKVPVREELVRLIVHGALHVLGHDHPETAARTRSAMWRKQERLVARLARNNGRR